MEESDGVVCIQDRLLWSTCLQATAPLIRPCCHLLLSPEVIIANKEQRESSSTSGPLRSERESHQYRTNRAASLHASPPFHRSHRFAPTLTMDAWGIYLIPSIFAGGGMLGEYTY